MRISTRSILTHTWLLALHRIHTHFRQDTHVVVLQSGGLLDLMDRLFA